MKKIIYISLICLFFCGCQNNSWKKEFQVSDIKIRVVDGFVRDDTYVSGMIKNISDYTCNSMNAIIEFKSGTLTQKEEIIVFNSNPLEPNETYSFEYSIMGKNYDGYQATVSELNCYAKKDTYSCLFFLANSLFKYSIKASNKP